MLQNLVMLHKTLPYLHEVVRELEVQVNDEERAPTLAEATCILSKIKDSTAVLNQRLFIIMTAQAKGWAWAKELEFLETGTLMGQY